MLTQIVQAWQKINTGQRVALVVGMALLVIVLCVVVSTASAPRYVQLYGNLTAQDASAVVEKLQEQKIPYHLTQNGSAIEVPQDKLDELRLSLASEGLPRGGNVGFELFDKTQLGQSEFTEHLNYRRALEGELSRTIGTIETVRGARVHLVLPEHRLYSEEQKQPTASVMLDLQGPDPTPNQIKAIIHLVSSAVEGLTPENVTIVDKTMRLLSDMMDQVNASSPGTRMRAERDAAMQIEGRVQTMLDTVLGPKKSIVRAAVTLNYDRKQYDREIFTPLGTLANSSVQTGVLERQQTARETYSGQRANGTGGAVGTAAALAPVVGSPRPDNGRSGDYLREENTASYVIPKTVEHVEVTPGSVQRMNLALFVDDSVGDDQVATLRETISASVGLDPTRGDVIAVTPMKFDKTVSQEEEKLAKQAERSQLIAMLTKYGLGSLLIAGFLFLLFVIFRTSLGPVKAQVQEPMLPDAHLAPELPMPDLTLMPMPSMTAVETYNEQQELTPQDLEEIPVEYNFGDIDPQRVAQVIRGLMTEE